MRYALRSSRICAAAGRTSGSCAQCTAPPERIRRPRPAAPRVSGAWLMTAPDTLVSRRAALSAGGALIVSFALGPSLAAAARRGPGRAAGTALPGSLDSTPMLDSWLRIDAHGITVFTGKAELGQGIQTALIQVAAEELAVEPVVITLVAADTARTPNEGYTA